MEREERVKSAMWAETIPDLPDGEPGRYFMVGKPISPGGEIIARITRQIDVPGLHCDMPRVCIWADDGSMLAEFPYTALACIGYQ